MLLLSQEELYGILLQTHPNPLPLPIRLTTSVMTMMSLLLYSGDTVERLRRSRRRRRRHFIVWSYSFNRFVARLIPTVSQQHTPRLLSYI